MPHQNEQKVRETLEKLARSSGLGYAAISRAIGRNPAYIQQYLKRYSPKFLSEEDRHRLAETLCVDSGTLGAKFLSQDLLPPAQDTPNVPSPPSTAAGTRFAPWLNKRSKQPEGLQICLAFLENLALPIDSDIRAHQIEGDSMAPTLLAGDHVLIHFTKIENVQDGLYAVSPRPAEPSPAPNDNTPIAIRRLSQNPATGCLEILCDNPLYPNTLGLKEDNLQILGRLIWMGRSIG